MSRDPKILAADAVMVIGTSLVLAWFIFTLVNVIRGA